MHSYGKDFQQSGVEDSGPNPCCLKAQEKLPTGMSAHVDRYLSTTCRRQKTYSRLKFEAFQVKIIIDFPGLV